MFTCLSPENEPGCLCLLCTWEDQHSHLHRGCLRLCLLSLSVVSVPFCLLSDLDWSCLQYPSQGLVISKLLRYWHSLLAFIPDFLESLNQYIVNQPDHSRSSQICSPYKIIDLGNHTHFLLTLRGRDFNNLWQKLIQHAPFGRCYYSCSNSYNHWGKHYLSPMY